MLRRVDLHTHIGTWNEGKGVVAQGSEAARAAHITLNCINLLLFAWQVPTGFDIVQKVWENVPWP